MFTLFMIIMIGLSFYIKLNATNVEIFYTDCLSLSTILAV